MSSYSVMIKSVRLPIVLNLVMPNAVLLPNGKVLIANGARTGTAGYDNVQDRVGSSNADNPVLQPVIYDPTAPAGQRFSSEGLPTSNIPRMYHSTMSLLPNGSIMIAGSNPNLDVETREYPTEYRVEKLSPPYILDPRPIISTFDAVFQYGRTAKAMIKLPAGLHTRGLADITAVIMDLGFSTHGVHTDQRAVMLASKPALGQLGSLESLVQITGPPNPNVNGVLCPCVKVMVGDGLSPPVDQGAISK
ncbi:hypothetical protein FRC07_000724 [Ceratobasidium sp. 392]|nr:hypothetical protein FRC07_000724 [Ceratobasidium sp. 392]